MIDLPRALLDTAEALARRTRVPRRADLRRAVSTAYYALFHALASEVADRLVGARRRFTPAWVRVYRALEHGTVRDRLERFASEKTTSEGLRLLCVTFAQLQSERHHADYDPLARFRREDVLGSLARCRSALRALAAADREERLELATRVLFRDRP